MPNNPTFYVDGFICSTMILLVTGAWVVEIIEKWFYFSQYFKSFDVKYNSAVSLSAVFDCFMDLIGETLQASSQNRSITIDMID